MSEMENDDIFGGFFDEEEPKETASKEDISKQAQEFDWASATPQERRNEMDRLAKLQGLGSIQDQIVQKRNETGRLGPDEARRTREEQAVLDKTMTQEQVAQRDIVEDALKQRQEMPRIEDDEE